MRRLHEPVRAWKPCSVCGHPAPYVHNGRRYCTRNECQLAAANDSRPGASPPGATMHPHGVAVRQALGWLP